MPSYTPAKLYPEDQTFFVVHVIPKVAVVEIDEADLDDAGNCAVAGNYLIAVCEESVSKDSFRNQALEIFHALNVITDPDHYHLVVSTYTPSMDGHLAADLGVWLGTSRLPRCFTHLDLDSRCA
jgi:hypothetical protein